MPTPSVPWAIAACLLCAAAAPPLAAKSAPLTVSDDGLGPMGAATPFDEAALTALLPGFEVEASAAGDGRFIALRDGAPALEIFEGEHHRVGQILVTAPGIPTATGATVARSAGEVYTGGRMPNCVAGKGMWSGRAFCLSPRQKYVVLIFSGDWDGPPETVPPGEVLKTWTVEAILWRHP